jgi:uncharacterized iron-regulated protein
MTSPENLRTATLVRRAPLAAVLAAAVLSTGACASGTAAPARGPAPSAAVTSSGYVPHRVYDVAAAAFIDFETLAARAASADVVFFGERHGLGPGHRLQHALLEALFRRGGATLSLEMFERDVAPVVDAYAAGDVSTRRLLAEARPWPRYETDYRPAVDFARHVRWQVIAANVPREIAALVAREGLAGLDGLPAAQRAHVAAELHCPADEYRERFIAEMRRHPMGEPGTVEEEAAREQRYYESQCVKDETMAESIAGALVAGAPRPVVHLTGAFHSDHGDGIPARLQRRMPGVSMLSLTLVPVADLDGADPTPHVTRADYILFTLQT